MTSIANHRTLRRALGTLALAVCAVSAIWAQAPAMRHNLPSLSRVERALAVPNLTPPPTASPEVTLPAISISPESEPGGAPVTYAGPRPTDPIQIQFQYAWKWKQDDRMMLFARGDCRVTQGNTVLQADEIVIWGGAEEASEEEHLTLYLEGDAQLAEPGRTVRQESMLAQLHTRAAIKLARKPIDGSMADSATFQRGEPIAMIWCKPRWSGSLPRPPLLRTAARRYWIRRIRSLTPAE